VLNLTASAALRPFTTWPPCEFSFDSSIAGTSYGNGTIAGMTFVGFWGNYITQPVLSYDFYQDSENHDVRKIYGINNLDLGEYIPGTMDRFTIRFGSDKKVSYWINGSNKGSIIIDPEISDEMASLNIVFYGSSAYAYCEYLSLHGTYSNNIKYDNIKVYSRHGLND
jgi:hypothetical protein